MTSMIIFNFYYIYIFTNIQRLNLILKQPLNKYKLIMNNIIYTLISKENQNIIFDYTEYSGNFPILSIHLLKRLKINKKGYFHTKKYSFYYFSHNNLFLLCLCLESFPKEDAYLYLEELLYELYNKFTMSELEKEKTRSIIFEEIFNPVIKKINQKYNIRNHENSNVHTVNIRDYNEEIVDFQLDTELIVNCMNEKDNNKDDFVVERSNGKFSLFCMISIVLIIFVIILVTVLMVN